MHWVVLHSLRNLDQGLEDRVAKEASNVLRRACKVCEHLTIGRKLLCTRTVVQRALQLVELDIKLPCATLIASILSDAVDS